MISFPLALMAIVESQRHVYGKGTMSRGRAIIERTVSVPLIAASPGRLKADQAEYLFHRDLIANLVKVDTWHGFLSSRGGFGGDGVRMKDRSVPFPYMGNGNAPSHGSVEASPTG